MILDIIYRRYKDTVDILKCRNAVSTLRVWRSPEQ